MNISKAQIAALVLGYLKSEKLQSVVDEFTKCCCYFTENNANVKMGKYFVTRVAGLTLVDIIEQYSVIYAIVQSRLEETDYFDMYSRTTLVEQLLYLVDRELNMATSSPVENSSEVDATPAHSLPGNSSSFQENENSSPKTPKKRNARSKSKEKEEVIDMTEVLTQSLLENHELHEKIAETINIVRNTPDGAKPTIDERISAGASKEIDAVIKTVIQRTEEDPVYNKLIDEIIGTAPYENPPTKKLQFSSTPSTTSISDPQPEETPHGHLETKTDIIEAHNNDAIRSIIEAAQNSEAPPPPPPPSNPDPPPPPPPPTNVAPPTNTDTGEVYVFDGTLDTYLKTSGATNPINPNVYINPGGLIVMPPPEPTKQFYIVNNQPVIKMNMPTVLTENEFMSIPTIIVNDEPPSQPPKPKRNKPIKPKGTENSAKIPEVKPTEAENVSRLASHVRNLDFSTPSGKTGTKKKKAWDSDLRELITGCKDKSPSPKRKRVVTKKKKIKKEEEDKPAEEREKASLLTPVKDVIPKTPEGPLGTSGFHCTPFNDVIDEQLRGVDLSSIPTPSLPITPGFALTPGDMVGTNHRSTDYSTSSSYYQPSEPEPPKSTEELMEELRELDNTSPSPPKALKIISNTVITPAKEPTAEKKKHYTEHVTKFNNKVIGKKNLNLIKQLSTSSSSSDSDSDKEKDETVVCKNNAAVIKDIISNVQVKKTLDDDKKSLLSTLEAVRKRTVDKLKDDGARRKQPVRNTKKVKAPRTKKNAKKKETSPEDDAQKLVKGLAQRGIHLIPNKTPQKPHEEEKKKVEESPEEVFFDKKECTYEIAVHEDKTKRRNMKTYDFTVLKKPISATVFDDDLNQEVTRIIRWTNCECIYDTRVDYEELINIAVIARGESPRGGRKRKSKLAEDEVGYKDKKNKTYVNYNKLLKKIDVDDFLDKLHG